MSPPSPGPIPLFERLILEAQSDCNRACWFCPRIHDRSGKYLDREGRATRRHLPTEKILDLLDQARDMGFSGEVGFHHYSEPLLDERHLYLAREARRLGMAPYLTTNGDKLHRDGALAREVARSYDRIVIGLYDYDDCTELEKAKQRWRRMLGDARLEFSCIGRAGRESGESMAVPRALVPPDRRMTIPDLVYPNAPCHRPLVRLIVQYDGGVCNCCEDLTGAFGLGNLFESSLEEVWFGEAHLQVVRDLQAGRRELYQLCSVCPLGPTGAHPDGERIDFFLRRKGAAQ